MNDLLKKIALLGFGAASMSREKAQELADEIAANMKISREEGSKVVDDIIKEAQKLSANVQERGKESFKSTLDSLNVATKADIERLENRIKSLEDRLLNS